MTLLVAIVAYLGNEILDQPYPLTLGVKKAHLPRSLRPLLLLLEPPSSAMHQKIPILIRRFFILPSPHLLPPRLLETNPLRVLPTSRKRNWSFYLKTSESIGRGKSFEHSRKA
ncbi:hypothetical protein FXO38_20422 [Capsicum annuum]|nr:hypothetical protein FXO38_20422 [Capsicum annuum]